MNTEKRDSPAAAQMLVLKGRNLLEVRGVTDVVRFDEENVVLSFNGAVSPFILQCEQAKDSLYLILPVRNVA